MSIPDFFDPSIVTDEKIAALQSRDDCAAVMAAMDLKIGAIEAQVHDKSRPYDPEWYHRARSALKHSKRQRNLAQERRGQIARAECSIRTEATREEKLEREKLWDRHFVLVAKDNLAPVEYRRLCDLAVRRFEEFEP